MQFVNRILCGVAVSACLLMAQGDPPGRVARLSYIYGSSSYLPGGVDDWAPVDFNRPLTTGDRLFVEVGGTAELQLGCGALRMNQATSLEFLNLDDSNVQLRLSEGSLLIHLRYLSGQESFEVDTPNLAFTLASTGVYRIDVKPDLAATIVTVRDGQGEVTGPDQAFSLNSGQQMRVTGTDQVSYQPSDVPPPDYLDTWSAGRDQKEDQSPSARYVSRQLIGYQDLDQYGSWRTTPEYGAVWVPNGTPAGWAPYHNGHWLWVDPWGWTWVDDAQWGFAPFHYGRWAYVGGYWGWVPGPLAARPVYAPALVAWVGGGAVGGGVAWFALGPREVFVPSYHTSPVYLNQVNISNTVIVNNTVNVNVTNVTYVNRSAPGAVMAVQQAAFVSAKPVQSAAIVVRPEAIRSAPIVATSAVAPTRASVTTVAAPGAKVVQPPAALQARAVVAKRTPPPPPVPFAQKQQALTANAGRPLDTNQVQQIRQSQPAPPKPLVRQVQARTPAPAPPARPAAQAPAPAGQRPAPAPQSAPPVQRPAATPQPAPAVQRPAPAPPKPAAPPAVAPAPAPAQPREVQRPAAEPKAAPPAPAANRPPAAASERPAPKKNEDKKNEDKKKEDKKEDK